MVLLFKVCNFLLFLIFTKNIKLCTTIKPTFIGDGELVSKSNFPYQVFIYSTADKEKDQFCGGSILNNSFVVTAANCYLGADWTHYVFAVDKFIVHNGWNESSLAHDIALIKIQGEFWAGEFTTSITSIGIIDHEVRRNTIFNVSGWGYTEFRNISDEFHSVNLQLIPPRICKQKLKKFEVDSNGKMCLQNLKKPICPGDSGGPAAVNGQLAGIASVVSMLYVDGVVICIPGGINLYSDAYFYRNWILYNDAF